METNWPEIRETIVGVVEAIRNVVEKVSTAIAFIWEKYGDQIRDYTEAVWDAISSVVGGAIRAIKGVINAVTALLSGDWSAFWDGLKDIVAGVWEAITGIVRGAVGTVKATLSAAWISIKAVAQGALNGLKNAIGGIIGGIVGIFSGAKNLILGVWATLWGFLGRVINSGPVRTALRPIIVAIDAVRATIQAAIDTYRAFRRLFSGNRINLPRVGGQAIGSSVASSIGGRLIKRHDGGWVGRPSGPPRDIPAILQQGEYVLSRATVADLMTGRAGVSEKEVRVIHMPAPDWLDPTIDAHLRRLVRDEMQGLLT